MAEGHRVAARSVLDGGEHGVFLDQGGPDRLRADSPTGSLPPTPNSEEPKNPARNAAFASAFAIEGRDTNLPDCVARRNLIRLQPGIPQ
jgi:hypothetical protein